MENNQLHTDQQLVEQLRVGNEACFTEIYNRYWEPLFFMAHKRLSSADDAKEIIQNVFLNLWQKRERLDIQSLPLYLAGMTRYAIYRFLANAKRRGEVMKDFTQTEGRRLADSFDPDNKQLLEILSQLGNELPENYRLLFIHHKLLDRPLEEVAAMLGISPRTAERHVAKLMEIMRRHRSQLNLALLLL